MADMKFNCPHCQQEIQCDELWGGHQINCPTCQGAMTVPQAAAPVAPAALPGPPGMRAADDLGKQLVAVPKGGARLSAGATQVARSSSGTGTPQKGFQRQVEKKSNPVLKWAIMGVVFLAAAAGGYYAVDHFLLNKKEDDSLSKPAAAKKKTDGGGGGPAAEANATMDTADALSGGGSSASDSGGRRPRQANPSPDAGGTAPAAADKLPVVAPVYSLDPDKAKIPTSQVNGLIAGANFVAEAARFDSSRPGSYALTLRQGTGVTPDRGVYVFLRLKSNEGPTNRTFTVSPTASDPAVSSVTKLWKTDPKYAAKQQPYQSGYALKLELGQMTNDLIPGKIFLALPDTEKTVLAGLFNATLGAPPAQMTQGMPGTQTTADPGAAAAKAAYDRRYGPRR